MRFMIIRKADKDTEAGAMPSEQLISDMADYNHALLRAGVLVAGEGLRPTVTAARVRFSAGTPVVTDGPFTEAKELIAGYTIIQTSSREEAIEWAKRWPATDGGGCVDLELREMYEVDDFGSSDEVQQHIEIRNELAAKPAASASSRK